MANIGHSGADFRYNDSPARGRTTIAPTHQFDRVFVGQRVSYELPDSALAALVFFFAGIFAAVGVDARLSKLSRSLINF